MQNNIKVALIEHRTGVLSEIPESLNQSELGFAYDANRLFIGNPQNDELALRTTFPYKNVEILTEFSDLHNYVSYRYVNNIKKIDDITEAEQLIEHEPFMIVCDIAANDVSGTLTLNEVTIPVIAGKSLTELAKKINENYEQSKVSAFVNNDSFLIFICTSPILTIQGTSGVLDSLGIPTDIDPVAQELPERKLTEKLDDTLHITDFGVNASTGEAVTNDVMKACVEIYNRYRDSAVRRNIFFPAGTYNFDAIDNVSFSVPLITGTTLYGEGIDNTIFSFTPMFNAYCMQGMDTHNQYTSELMYQSEIISNVVIKDLTLDCQGGTGALYLRNMQDVRFENVKFIFGGNVVKIFGDTSEYKSKNITFKNCVFVGGSTQIDIGKNCENINILNCRFEQATNKSIAINGENITRIICDNNLFLDMRMLDCINYVGTTATYVSFTNSKFDSNVAEYAENTVRPFNDGFGISGKNYTDTLDPTTDERKFLRFHFTQPKWDYISQLIDENGVLTLNVRRDNKELEQSDKLFADLHITDNSVNLSVEGNPLSASLNITNNKGGLNVSTSGNSTTNIGGNLTETINGNKSESVTGHKVITADEITETASTIHEFNAPEIIFNGEIKLGNNIDLQSNNGSTEVHTIYNSGNSDIIIEAKNNQLIRAYPLTENPEQYGERAIVEPNALVTSNMLKQYQSTIHGFAKNVNVDGQGNIELYDCSKYQSDNLVLKELSINFIQTPTYKPHSFIDSVFPYCNGTSYKENTLISVGSKYYKASSDFVASVSQDTSQSAIGTYITEQTTVYDDDGNVITDFDMGNGFKFVEFSYDGALIYHICDNTDAFLPYRSDEDKPSPIDGEMMYCFLSGTKRYFIKNLPTLLADQNQLIKVIEKQIVENEPVVVLSNVNPFSGIIDTFDIVLISTNPLDSNDVKYYVLGRIENINGTFELGCSPWSSEQLAGRVSVFQPEQKYNPDALLRYQGLYYQCVVDNYTDGMTYEEKANRILNGAYFLQLPKKGIKYTYNTGSGIYRTDSENGTVILESVNMELLNLTKCKVVLRFFDSNGNHISVMNNTPDIEALNIGYFVEAIR